MESENESWGNNGDDDSNDDDSDDVTKDDDNDDVDSDADGDKEASDSEKTDSDKDVNPNLNQNNDEEEEYEEEYVRTPESFEFTEDDEEYEELYKDMNVHHEEPSTHTPPLLNIPVTVIPETLTATGSTIPPIILPITPLSQQSAPTPAPAPTTTATITSIPALLDFSSLFEIDQRVSALEKELSQFKQANYSAKLLETMKSQILAIVDAQLSTRLEDSIKKAFRSYTAKFEKKAKDERKRYIDLVEKSMKDIIIDEIKSQLLQILLIPT
ncbi:hypothetical protein Tco_0381295 [Tanacetum coccineum]